MNLLIVGGAHGVGKTTLLDGARAALPAEVAFFDPGEYFWRHLYGTGDLTAAEVERLVAAELLRLRDRPLVVSNWHYAVWTPAGWVPQLPLPLWRETIASLAPAAVRLVLVEAPAEVILARRLRDRKQRKRKLDRAAVERELAESRRYRELFLREVSGLTDIAAVDIDNVDLAAAQRSLLSVLNRLL